MFEVVEPAIQIPE